MRKALRQAGWRPVRQRGSHEVWKHPRRPGQVIVAGKDNETVPVGTLSNMRRTSGLEELR
ncbi:MAG: type II toxin-antitoxin system HicA family toxin [Actinomycetota bacterium]|nr:type II toxin-antitoxin system HicA family toxin [Actinomycetota bacterium]